MKLLFDASSVLQVIRSFKEEKALRVLGESCILDLTKYEVGNALWKEHTLRSTIGEDELQEFLTLLRGLLLHTRALTVDGKLLSDVGQVASKERITFYDASYIAVAKAYDLTLITEDKQLARAASRHIKTATAGKAHSI